jgi:hypothetical protein
VLPVVFQNGSRDPRLLLASRDQESAASGSDAFEFKTMASQELEGSGERRNKTFVVDLDSGMQAKSLKLSRPRQKIQSARFGDVVQCAAANIAHDRLIAEH